MNRDLNDLVPALPTIAPEAVDDHPLITDVLSLIDYFLDSGHALDGRVGQKELVGLRELLDRAVLQVVGPVDPRDGRPYGNSPARQMVKKLGDWILPPGWLLPPEKAITVISTNYDTLVDTELIHRLGSLRPRRPSDPMDGSVDFGFTWRAVLDGSLNHRPHSPQVRIFKLHGSRNWLACDACGSIYINLIHDIHQLAASEQTIPSNTCHCGRSPLKAVIVAPSMMRAIRDPNLLTLWQSALEALRLADSWILVGYSLPSEDLAIRSILLRAARGRPGGQPPMVTVVLDREDSGVVRRYRQLFPQAGFQFEGFEGFIGRLEPRQEA